MIYKKFSLNCLTLNDICDDSVDSNKTIMPPIERKFNYLSNHGSLKSILSDFSKVRLITAHSGILTFSGHQKSSFGVQGLSHHFYVEEYCCTKKKEYRQVHDEIT